MDDEYNKRINYRDIAENSGYAIAYEKDGEYFIELIIEEIDYAILSDYIIDPKYYNDTDGFDTLAAGAANPIGITTVKLIGRRGNKLKVKGLDILNGTPIIDIKPYLPQYDKVADGKRTGWVNKLEVQISET